MWMRSNFYSLEMWTPDMTDTTVKVFQSTDSGAPSLSGTAGSLIALLDACLINGYGSITFDSVVIAGNVATCTKSTGHGFTAIGTVGPVIRMAGVSVPSALNADWRTTVVSSTVVTFVTSGIADQTATGTITAKRAPAGFSKAFSGTNKAAYRSDDTSGTRLYLRVDDTPAQYPTLIMYETMSDVDTGSGPAPTTGSLFFGKSFTANSTSRAWRLFADTRGFYLIANPYSGAYYDAYCHFIDIVSYKPGDAFCANLKGHTTATYTNIDSYSMNTWGLLAKSYVSTGSAIATTAKSHGIGSSLGGNIQLYPAPVNNEFQAWPIEVWESSNTIARGLVPGLWNPIHKTGTGGITDGLIISDIPQLSGRTLFCQVFYNGLGSVAFDVSGPWR